MKKETFGKAGFRSWSHPKPGYLAGAGARAVTLAWLRLQLNFYLYNSHNLYFTNTSVVILDIFYHFKNMQRKLCPQEPQPAPGKKILEPPQNSPARKPYWKVVNFSCSMQIRVFKKLKVFLVFWICIIMF